MVIAHTGIVVPAASITDAVKWYTAALAPIGYKKTMTFMEGAVNGFSDSDESPHEADWWVSAARDGSSSCPPSHHAFFAKDRASVDAFYKAGIDAGGKDNGGPGVRAQYGPTYYAAFVHDPAGNNIEVVYIGAA